jgi:hypothetical protein
LKMHKTMIDINKEAEEYAKLIHEKQVLKIFKEHSKRDFIAGANSKYVQVEKLKFAIEAVLEFRKSTFGLGNSGLEKLQQQLKQLEDGK